MTLTVQQEYRVLSIQDVIGGKVGGRVEAPTKRVGTASTDALSPDGMKATLTRWIEDSFRLARTLASDAEQLSWSYIKFEVSNIQTKSVSSTPGSLANRCQRGNFRASKRPARLNNQNTDM